MNENATEILNFWLDEVGPEGWYASDPTLDARIRERFGTLCEQARAGALDVWRCQPGSCLALVILLDQFPRNIYREDGRSFASDPKALATAKIAIAQRHDRAFEPPARHFFYLPLMHSESRSEQDRSVRLMLLNVGHGAIFRHAQAHREVIRRFGRFPYRNAVLGRHTTPAEAAFLEAGGYRSVMEAVSG